LFAGLGIVNLAAAIIIARTMPKHPQAHVHVAETHAEI
jgi:hypothetical protein